uniref:Uncharacterized protein n=1 Tax=Raoultella ornithinolytica TaxID=54291 RepID=A0A3T0VFQ1_RAOOR|nr:hypothetical protein [Raoultella ornithinolytica]
MIQWRPSDVTGGVTDRQPGRMKYARLSRKRRRYGVLRSRRHE